MITITNTNKKILFDISEEGGLKKCLSQAGFVVERYFSRDTDDAKIIRAFLHDCFDNRTFINLHGETVEFEPLYDSENKYPEAFALKHILESILSGQLDMMGEGA